MVKNRIGPDQEEQPALRRRQTLQKRVLVALAAAAFHLLATPNLAFASETKLVDYLVSRDLVVEGILQSVQRGMRFPAGGCGASQTNPLRIVEYRLKLSRVILGTAEDSLLVIASLGGQALPQAVPGVRVIGYANRVCADSWRLWGGAIVVDGEELRWKRDEFVFDGSYRDLQDQVGLGNASPFEHSGGVSQVRLTRYWRDERARTINYSCESLGWILPTSARIPRAIRFERSLECDPLLAPGDTLLVPIATGSEEDTLEVRACPRALVIHDGFLGGLGVALGEVDRALSPGWHGVRVASVLGPKSQRH
jgi:hypothetical protein